MPRPRNPKPSPKQIETYRFILDYIQTHAYQPSMMEMAEHFKITKTAINDRLNELEERGLIKRALERDRAIELPGVQFVVKSIRTKDRGPKEQP